MNNRIQRGNVAELVVASEASKRNITVSMPISHNSYYDLILDIHQKLFRVQIKRVYLVNNHGRKIICVESRRISGKKRWAYPDTSYDFLLACNPDTNDIWFIPFEITKHYKAQIYLDTEKTNQYKNQWSLLGVDVSS